MARMNGKKTQFKKGRIPWNKGKSSWAKGRHLSESHRKKIGEAQKGKRNRGVSKSMPPHPKGKDHWHWKGGISTANQKVRSSGEYKLWRTAVFQRDKFTCQWCGAKNGNGKTIVLNADHIKPFAFFPELRFAIDNGRTLCEDCHKKTPTYGGNYKVLFIK